jgi:large subunit ribosomal protein L21
MFAIVETGGKQYRVSPNEKIIVEKLVGEVGSKVILNKVLMINREHGESTFGDPILNGVEVEAEIVKFFKDDKVIIFKKRRRKNSRRKNGHRQRKTLLKIVSING